MNAHHSLFFLGLCLGLVGGPGAAAQNACEAVQLLPPHSVAYGKTVSEWAAEWWRWVLSVPEEENPLFDGTGERCGLQQTGKVFFLVDTWRSSVQESDITAFRERCVIPYGRAIFFPISRQQVFIPLPCTPNCPDERILCEKDLKPHVKKIQFACTIDGCPFTGLSTYDEGDDCTTVSLDLGPRNFVGMTPGRYQVMSSGIWLMLEPLRPGPHRIHFEGLFDPTIDPNTGEEVCVFCQRVTYDLRVEGPSFRRGDVDGGGTTDLSDPIEILTRLFLTGEEPPCPDAADAGDDGAVDISDAVYLIDWLFLGGGPPSDPGPHECGVDPTADELGPCSQNC